MPNCPQHHGTRVYRRAGEHGARLRQWGEPGPDGPSDRRRRPSQAPTGSATDAAERGADHPSGLRHPSPVPSVGRPTGRIPAQVAVACRRERRHRCGADGVEVRRPGRPDRRGCRRRRSPWVARRSSSYVAGGQPGNDLALQARVRHRGDGLAARELRRPRDRLDRTRTPREYAGALADLREGRARSRAFGPGGVADPGHRGRHPGHATGAGRGRQRPGAPITAHDRAGWYRNSPTPGQTGRR